MNRKLKVLLIIIGILGGAVALTIFFIKLKKNPESNVKQQFSRYVKAKKVAYADLPCVIETSGRMMSYNEVIITSSVSGTLKEGNVPFKTGQSFKAGQLLLMIYDDEFIYSHYARKSRFLQTLANMLPDLKVDFPEAFDKWNYFFQSVHIKDYLPDLPNIESPKERVYLASKSILNDYYTIKSEEARLDKYSIRAPFDGTINEVSQQIGAYVNAGARLSVISRTDLYEIEVPVITAEISFVRKNQSVDVLDESGDLGWSGVVSRISNVVDPSTQSVSVFCQIRNNQNRPLFDGRYHQVRIHGLSVKDALSIPRNALYNGNEVYVIGNEKAIKKKVSVVKYNENTAFINGLEPGEELAVEPLTNLTGNAKFEIIR